MESCCCRKILEHWHHYEFWLIVGRDCRDHMIAGFITTYVICLSPLTLRVWIPLRGVLLDTTLFDKVCQWLATGQWFSPNTPAAECDATNNQPGVRFRVVVFSATFNNILVISWWSVLLVEATGVFGENHWPVASHWQTLSHNVVSSIPHLTGILTHASGDSN
jgi:hypothetical protein